MPEILSNINTADNLLKASSYFVGSAPILSLPAGLSQAQEITLPVTINGKIQQAEDVDSYKFKVQADKLEKALTHEGGSAEKHAKYFRDVVIPNMSTLRELGDAIELAMPHELWPLATYREMLFIK